MSNTPKLRFKEFSGEWESKKLGDIIEYKKGYAFKSNNYRNEGVRIIKISDTSATSIKDTDITCISEEEAFNYEEWKLKAEDIIVSTVGSRPPLYSSMVGKIILIPKRYENTLLNQNLVRLRSNNLSTQGYLYTYLNSKKYLNYIEGICRGNANQVSITLEDLFEYNVSIPSKAEQEKIASFFSLIDKKIEKQGEKVEALKDYKKGIMQKIFSRKIRFKDDNGRDYPEWEKVKIKECFEERSERGYSDLELLSVSIQDGIKRRCEIEGKDNSSEDKSNYKMVEINDIVYNSMRMWQGASGISYYKGIVSPAYTVLKPKSKVYSKYFSYRFKMNDMIYEFRRFSQGLTSDTWNLKYPQLKDIKVDLPSIDEQIKISNFIDKIDKKIEKEQEKLDLLNQYKKGLLQQMFV